MIRLVFASSHLLLLFRPVHIYRVWLISVSLSLFRSGRIFDERFALFIAKDVRAFLVLAALTAYGCVKEIAVQRSFIYGGPGRQKLDRRIDWALSHPATSWMFA
jgi:hypothetical protein